MTFDRIAGLLEGVPFIPPERGRLIYEFVRSTQPAAVLELGFAHGTSSCYIAAALEENGAGMLTTIDNVTALERRPTLQEQLDRCGLASRVTPRITARSYNWELMKMIEERTQHGVTTPQFDFVFIDGGHTWDSDGFAFLLTDRLLKPGGWLLLDDMMWMPAECAGEPWVEAMPEEERHVAHVEKIFSLLVCTHPSYDSFEFDGHWAWARKRPESGLPAARAELLRDIYARTDSARRSYKLRRYLKKLLRSS